LVASRKRVESRALSLRRSVPKRCQQEKINAVSSLAAPHLISLNPPPITRSA